MRSSASLLTQSAKVFLGMPADMQRQLIEVINPALRIAGAPEAVIKYYWELLDQLESGQGCVKTGALEKVDPYIAKVAEVVDCYGFTLPSEDTWRQIAHCPLWSFGRNLFEFPLRTFDSRDAPPENTVTDTLKRVLMEIPRDRKEGSPIKPYLPIIFGMEGIQLSSVYLKDEDDIVKELKSLPHVPKIVILGPSDSKTEIQYAFRLLDRARRSGVVQVYEYFDAHGFCQILYEDGDFLNKALHQVEFYSDKNNGDFFKAPISEADVVILLHSDHMAEKLLDRVAAMTRPGGRVLWQHDYDWNPMIMSASNFSHPIRADEILARARTHFEIKNHHSGMAMETWAGHAFFYYQKFPVEYFCLKKLP